MTNHHWRPIPGYAYLINRDGDDVMSCPRRVRCITPDGHETTRRVKAHFLKPNFASGRPRVTLYADGVAHHVDLAPAVLTAFGYPRPSAGHYVEFLNGDVTDWRLANLRWVRRGRSDDGHTAAAA